jgi:mannose-6-phosphate isomerase-like protein (cupin superfamily)
MSQYHGFMKKIIILIFSLSLVLTAGCLSTGPGDLDHPQNHDTRGLVLLAPMDPFPIFEGQVQVAEIVQKDPPLPPLNYTLAYVMIMPGNATPPHRLLGSSELVYVIRGTARIECDSERIMLGEEELAFLPEGILQSIAAVGQAPLHYLSVVDPPFTSEIEISGEDLAAYPVMPDGTPVVVRDPGEGIEWDYETGTSIYTLVNPILMPEKGISTRYSVAYAEILPGGHVAKNRLVGLNELIYVIEGEIVITSEEEDLRVSAGSAGFVPAGTVKEYSNPGLENAKILSFVDPPWRAERAEILADNLQGMRIPIFKIGFE